MDTYFLLRKKQDQGYYLAKAMVQEGFQKGQKGIGPRDDITSPEAEALAGKTIGSFCQKQCIPYTLNSESWSQRRCC